MKRTGRKEVKNKRTDSATGVKGVQNTTTRRYDYYVEHMASVIMTTDGPKERA